MVPSSRRCWNNPINGAHEPSPFSSTVGLLSRFLSSVWYPTKIEVALNSSSKVAPGVNTKASEAITFSSMFDKVIDWSPLALAISQPPANSR